MAHNCHAKICVTSLISPWQLLAVVVLPLVTSSPLHVASIGDFRVALRLCFKASPSAKPFIYMSIKLIPICKTSCSICKTSESICNRGESQLGNHLFLIDLFKSTQKLFATSRCKPPFCLHEASCVHYNEAVALPIMRRITTESNNSHYKESCKTRIRGSKLRTCRILHRTYGYKWSYS